MNKIIVLLAVAALVVAGCGEATPDENVTGGSEGLSALGDGAWMLGSATVDGAALDLVEDHPVTLERTEDGLGGRSACNHYFGSVEEDGEALRISELGGTEMGCLADGVMELEAAYLAALARVTAASREGDDLVLTGEGVEMVFAPVPVEPDASLSGTTWVLETLLDGDSASSTVNSPHGDSEATLVISEAGEVEGSTGCNAFGGSAEVVDGLLEFPTLHVTEMACEGVMDQEAHVLDVLGGSPALEIDGRQLTLLLEDGRGLVYRAAG